MFRDLVQYTARHDLRFTSKLESMPKNEVLDVLSKMVIEKIKLGCDNAVFFTIGADETKDVSKKELLTVTLRY